MNGVGKTLWPTNHLGFEPRVGFAYQPTHATTVRASYGLIHAPLTGVTIASSQVFFRHHSDLEVQPEESTALPPVIPTTMSTTSPILIPCQVRGCQVSWGRKLPSLIPISPFPTFRKRTQFRILNSGRCPSNISSTRTCSWKPRIPARREGISSSSPCPRTWYRLQTILAEVASNTNFNQGGFLNKYGLGSGNLNVNSQPYPQFPSGVSQMFGRWGHRLTTPFTSQDRKG